MVKHGGEGRRRAAWGGFAALALLAAAPAVGQDVIGIPVGQTPPAVTIENLTGDTVSLSRWVGKKPVLVEFWATWCPICEDLLPRMVAAQKKYGDRAEFVVVAVAVNQSKNSVRRHIEKHPMPFTFLWDGNGAAVRAFQAPSTSYVAVMDASGKVVYTGVGENQDIDAAVQKAVGGSKGR
ncbi:MAG TPA: TlpA disulfide reductase family protein [Gemmatimonadales bacterium]|nr:TlpA disulfide reductase family protein [Gemmatimonadales bacterium]